MVLIGLFCLGAISQVFADEVLVPESKVDYGSGSTGMRLYYPGGIPEVGLFLGQPNTLIRNDRALAKFAIWPYVLSARPVVSAELCFGVAAFYAPEDAHEIEITHLSYDANSFSVNDMLNSRAEIAGTVSVKKNETADMDKEYSIDVTKYVNADIEKGNMFSAFRFKDVTAETKTRVNISTYGICLKTPFRLKLR